MNRGCGSRVPGGVYLNVPTSSKGLPLEHFLYCPAVPIPEELTLSPKGQQIVNLHGTPCVLDWIGANNYPNVADFIEEGRVWGFSRRVNPKLAVSLVPGSRLLPAHPKAIIKNWSLYPPRENNRCPKQLHPVEKFGFDRDMPWFPDTYPHFKDYEPTHDYEGCVGYWWEDLVEVMESDDTDPTVDISIRAVGDTVYTGMTRPSWMPEDYEVGIIASLPIGSIQVIAGAEGSEVTYQTVRSNASLPVEMVNE